MNDVARLSESLQAAVRQRDDAYERVTELNRQNKGLGDKLSVAELQLDEARLCLALHLHPLLLPCEASGHNGGNTQSCTCRNLEIERMAKDHFFNAGFDVGSLLLFARKELDKHNSNEQPFIPPGQKKFDVDMKIDPSVIAFSWVDEKTGKTMHRMSDGTVRESNEKRPASIAFSYSEEGRLKHRMTDGSVRAANGTRFYLCMTCLHEGHDGGVCGVCKCPNDKH